MTTLVIGDSHGSLSMVREALRVAQHLGVRDVVSVGDFGIWPGAGGKQFLDAVETMTAARDVIVRVIPGNHDDYDQIGQSSQDDDSWLLLRPRILAAPRGHVWQDDTGLTWQAMGGTTPPDGPGGIFPQVCGPAPAGSLLQHPDGRITEVGPEGHDLGGWWPQERITDEDIGAGIAAAEGTNIDVLITHDAPIQAPVQGEGDWPIGTRQRELLGQLVDAVKPAANIHGHWHYSADYTDRSDRRYVTLSADLNPDEPQWAVVSGAPGAPTVTIPRPWSPLMEATR